MINATTFLNHVVDTKLMDQADGIVALTKILSMDDQGRELSHNTCSNGYPMNSSQMQIHQTQEIDVAANAMKFRSVLGLHMSMDPVLLDACGDVLAAQFAGVTKVLTGAFMGNKRDPSREAGRSRVSYQGSYQVPALEAPFGNFNVSAEFFGPSDRVLIVDDFLASGQTAKALQQI
eukprot:Skav206608  [mRNA]  locus=scaffold332:200794:213138:- [translate_table: standard]